MSVLIRKPLIFLVMMKDIKTTVSISLLVVTLCFV